MKSTEIAKGPVTLRANPLKKTVNKVAVQTVVAVAIWSGLKLINNLIRC